MNTLTERRDATVSVCNVSKSFGGVRALQDVSLDVKPRSITALIGPNGAGKTTLVNVVSGVIRPDSGSVVFDGDDVTRMRAGTRARRGIQRTFQRVRLFPQLTVLENAMALDWSQRARRSPRSARNATYTALESFGLAKHAQRSPTELTFADRRRLEIVRCVLARPKLMMLDEPAAGMNPEEARQFVRQIGDLQRVEQLTMLLIEHNMKVVMGLAHTVYVLSFGAMIATGTPDDIRNDPGVIEAYLGASA